MPAETECARLAGPMQGSQSMPEGTVKFFNSEKGYGFITRPGEEDLFVQFSNIVGTGRSGLQLGAGLQIRGPGDLADAQAVRAGARSAARIDQHPLAPAPSACDPLQAHLGLTRSPCGGALVLPADLRLVCHASRGIYRPRTGGIGASRRRLESADRIAQAREDVLRWRPKSSE